jgi:hypothetical protein
VRKHQIFFPLSRWHERVDLFRCLLYVLHKWVPESLDLAALRVFELQIPIICLSTFDISCDRAIWPKVVLKGSVILWPLDPCDLLLKIRIVVYVTYSFYGISPDHWIHLI